MTDEHSPDSRPTEEKIHDRGLDLGGKPRSPESVIPPEVIPDPPSATPDRVKATPKHNKESK